MREGVEREHGQALRARLREANVTREPMRRPR